MLAVVTSLCKKKYIYIYLYTTFFAEAILFQNVNTCIFNGFTMHKHLFDMSGNKIPAIALQL